jgi:hypothetical protein
MRTTGVGRLFAAPAASESKPVPHPSVFANSVEARRSYSVPSCACPQDLARQALATLPGEAGASDCASTRRFMDLDQFILISKMSVRPAGIGIA